jgi:hypothetical protein
MPKITELVEKGDPVDPDLVSLLAAYTGDRAR